MTSGVLPGSSKSGRNPVVLITFSCPHCRQILRVADDKAGKTGSCPKCRQPVTVPALAPATSADKITVLYDEPLTGTSSPSLALEQGIDQVGHERLFEVAHGSRRMKPLTAEQIVTLLSAGQLTLSDMVTSIEGVSWKPLNEHPDLQEPLQKAGLVKTEEPAWQDSSVMDIKRILNQQSSEASLPQGNSFIKRIFTRLSGKKR